MAKHISSHDLRQDTSTSDDKPLRVKKLSSDTVREFIEISIDTGAVLAGHRADVPIAIVGIRGEGTFSAGEDLSESITLAPGVLITLDENVLHQVEAGQDLSFLLIKFHNARKKQIKRRNNE
jgi:quercetin dioxygenase-like cupin family protein